VRRRDQPVPGKSVPPYGPAKGMIEGLRLLQRSNPAKVDEALLRAYGIAPHNEYKVVGALRYLDLIDEHGVPTGKSRLLKTRGAAFKLHLQDIIRAAYRDLFASVPAAEATRERIYNYFVAEEGLAGEMATKATRFFAEVCRLAEISLGTAVKSPALKEEGKKKPSSPPTLATPEQPGVASPSTMPAGRTRENTLPFLFAITPELAAMSEEELYQLLVKLNRVFRRIAAEE